MRAVCFWCFDRRSKHQKHIVYRVFFRNKKQANYSKNLKKNIENNANKFYVVQTSITITTQIFIQQSNTIMTERFKKTPQKRQTSKDIKIYLEGKIITTHLNYSTPKN